jgi:glycerophosphoryl diester phosphodiesterase
MTEARRSRLRAARFAILLTLVAACARGGALPAPERKDSLPTPFVVIAHRGGAAAAPENTLPALDRSQRSGVRHVELDLQLSRDGALVLFHDETLAEKTGVAGSVRDYTASELAALDLGPWYARTHPGATESFAGVGLTTLGEVFARFGAAFTYHLEIKSSDPALPALLLAEIQRHALAQSATVTSFQRQQLERLRALDAQLPIRWLIRPLTESMNRLAILARARAARFQMVAFAAADLDADLVTAARAHGLAIRAWGVKSTRDIEHVLALGANGLTVDDPEQVFEILEARDR